MTGAYYAVKRKDPLLWLGGYNDDYAAWHAHALFRARLHTRADAVRAIKELRRRGYSNLRIVYVRVRPRSERLWMAERLAAWKPVVEAACADEVYHDDGCVPCRCRVCKSVRALPKEHVP